MKTLVIGKPIYDFIFSLVDFPKDGDKFFIDKAINSISGHASLVALTLGKYGMYVEYTGVVGDDQYSKTIKDIFNKHQVNLKYLETSYTDKTMISYKIYNMKSNKFTTINEINNKTGLTKYKYEFVPDTIVMDDKDYNANMAALNNYPNSKLIFIADKFNKTSNAYLNKCNYILTNLSFASDATGVKNDLDKEKGLVLLFQKYIDIYNSKLIIKLDNFDILYCVDDEVRIIKNTNKNLMNKDSIYYSVLVYFLINNYTIEEAIKLTNKVMINSSNEIDIINDIPDYSILEKTIKEYEEYVRNNNINISKSVSENINISIPENKVQPELSVEQNIQNTNKAEQKIDTNQNIQSVELHNPNQTNVDIEQLDINQNNGVNNA